MDLEFLKNKIFEKRLTYQQCAKRLKITVTTFSQKINGKSDFKVKEVVSLAKYLNLTQKEFSKVVFGK